MAISKEFKNRFAELVDELDLVKKTEIAKTIGITYATFGKIYNYGILPTVPILIRIADFFNVSIEYLLGNTNIEHIYQSATPASFQMRLEEQRIQKGISTIYELSQRVHIHRNNIAQWIKKEYLPTIDDLIVLSNLFDVSIDYLIGRTDDDTPLS